MVITPKPAITKIRINMGSNKLVNGELPVLVVDVVHSHVHHRVNNPN